MTEFRQTNETSVNDVISKLRKILEGSERFATMSTRNDRTIIVALHIVMRDRDERRQN